MHSGSGELTEFTRDSSLMSPLSLSQMAYAALLPFYSQSCRKAGGSEVH